jgi:hypothetical protein
MAAKDWLVNTELFSAAIGLGEANWLRCWVGLKIDGRKVHEHFCGTKGAGFHFAKSG